jgi:hypothetical protein
MHAVASRFSIPQKSQPSANRNDRHLKAARVKAQDRGPPEAVQNPHLGVKLILCEQITNFAKERLGALSDSRARISGN